MLKAVPTFDFGAIALMARKASPWARFTVCDDDLDIVRKAGGGVAVGPAALVFKGLREIPVEERDKRPHAGAENRVGEALVVIDALLVRGSRPGWLDTRPCDGVAIAAKIHLLHDGEVFRITMVVVAGDVSSPTAFYVAGGMTVAIPNGLASSVDIPCTFDLIGGGCASP
jgi:hypothetical protein